jgi:hypothetical protein
MAAKFSNTLNIPSHALRRMVAWVCKQVGYRVSRLRRVTYHRSRGGFSGLCHGSRHFGVRLGNLNYPVRHTRFGMTIDYADAWEVLVGVTAQESALCQQWLDSVRSRGPGGFHFWSGQPFRQQRFPLHSEDVGDAALLALRSPLKTSLQEKRAAKAEKMLAAWQRKMKLASTKVKQYRRKVKYYEGAMAAKRSGQKA